MMTTDTSDALAAGDGLASIARLAGKLHAKWSAFARLFYEVPWCVPPWGWREMAATLRAFTTGAIVTGDAAQRFAHVLQRYLGVTYVIPVNRGRTAIEIGLRAMGIGPGDEVVIPSYVCPSVVEGVLAAGGRPAYADVDETLNVTPATVAAAITERTRCVIAAHLYGRAADIDEIETMLRSRGIFLMDDAAQALGARCAGRLVGSFGDCGIVSCGLGKPLAGAAGGALVTNARVLFERANAIALDREETFEVARRTVACWVWRRARRYTLAAYSALNSLRAGQGESKHVSASLSNLDAEIAIAQFESLDKHAAERRRNAEILMRRLVSLGGQIVTDFSPNGMAVKLVYILPEGGMSALEAVTVLARSGIEAQAGYTPLHPSTHDACVPTTVALRERVLTVPLDTTPRVRPSIGHSRS